MKDDEAVAVLREDSKRMVRELGLLDTEYRNSGLALSECHILLEILKSPCTTVGDLAQVVNLDKSTTSRLVGNMVKRGFVEYAEDASDKRRRPLRMTKKGGELAKKIDAHAKGRVADALVLLKPEEKNTVLQGMSLYAQALRKARLKQEVIIGEITPQESSIITKITLDVLTEYGCNRPGFASHDEKLHDFYAVYQEPRSKYFVAHLGDKVVGGAGIAPLEGGDDKTCELQRMYILKEARGLGLGAMLINKCLEAAKKFGFSLCYLETTESMKEAQELYRKHGFTECKKRLGDTGHFGCEKLYEKKL